MIPPGPCRAQFRLAPYLFLAPSLILLTIFVLYPLAWSIPLSLYKYATPRTRQFIGLGHYNYLLHDKLFWIALANTLAYTFAIVLILIPASLGLALLLSRPGMRFVGFFRFAFFSSHLVGYVFVAVIFRMLLAQRHGLMARSLGVLHPSWSEIGWLSDPVFARLSVVLAVVWVNLGWCMIYFLAALSSIDAELYDAARLDGAQRWRLLAHITLPAIRPIMLFMIVVLTIAAFQIFELPYMLFDNSTGPAQAGLTVVMYLYLMGFEFGDLGAASAIGWMLAAMVFLIAATQVRLFNTWKEAD